jgi:hypothetical protein
MPDLSYSNDCRCYEPKECNSNCHSKVNYPGKPMHLQVKLVTLFTIFTIIISTTNTIAGINSVAETYDRFPVEYVTDVVVVGSNEGGVAAALSAARAGAKVVVLFGNYFPSNEMSAKNRYWLTPGEATTSALSQEMLGTNTNTGQYFYLKPNDFKKNIENLLVTAGIEFLYNTQAVGTVVDGKGNLSGVVIANKSGIQVIGAKVVIDATQMAGFAQLAGVQMTPWPGGNMSVTATFTGGTGGTEHGSFHEYSFTVPMPTGSWADRCNAENLLRKHLPYRQSVWAPNMMHLVEPGCIIARGIDTSTVLEGALRLNLDCCRPLKVKNLYVLGSCSAVSRAAAANLIRRFI